MQPRHAMPDTPDGDADRLARVPLLGGLAPDEVARVAAMMGRRQCQPGELIVREGALADALYLIDEGEVAVIKESPVGPPQVIATLGPGECFGEMALIDIQPRSASARARTRVRLRVLRAADLQALCQWRMRAYLMIVMNIAREISRRLRRTDALLADFLCLADHPQGRAAPAAGPRGATAADPQAASADGKPTPG